MSRTRVVTLSVLFFLVAVGGGAIGRAYFAEPGPWTDYVGKINAYVEEHEPEGEAAWPVYREMVIERFGAESADDGSRSPLYERIEATVRADGYDPGVGDWPDAAHDETRALLADADPVFDALDAAASRPRLGKRYARVGDALTGEKQPDAIVGAIEVLLPEMSYLRTAAVLNTAGARDAAERGDWDAFARRTEAGVALGEHTLRAGVLIELLVGVSIAALHLDPVRHALNEREIPADVCRRLDHTLEIDLRAPTKHAMEIERFFMLSALEMTHDRGGMLVTWSLDRISNGFSLTGGGGPTPLNRLLNVRTYAEPRMDEAVAIANERYAFYQDAVDAPPADFATTLDDPAFGFSGNNAIDMILPAISRVLTNSRRLERDLRAARLMLRLERVHAETGAWPESLEAPELAELNEDPLTGEPFAYERTPSDSHGRPYVLTAPQTPLQHVGGEELNPPRSSFEGE